MRIAGSFVGIAAVTLLVGSLSILFVLYGTSPCPASICLGCACASSRVSLATLRNLLSDLYHHTHFSLVTDGSPWLLVSDFAACNPNDARASPHVHLLPATAIPLRPPHPVHAAHIALRHLLYSWPTPVYAPSRHVSSLPLTSIRPSRSLPPTHTARPRPLISHASFNYGVPASFLRTTRIDAVVVAFLSSPPTTTSDVPTYSSQYSSHPPAPSLPIPRPVTRVFHLYLALTLCILRCVILTPLALSHKTLYSSILSPHATLAVTRMSAQKMIASRSLHHPGIGFSACPTVSSPAYSLIPSLCQSRITSSFFSKALALALLVPYHPAAGIR
ncbi:hypothetical protein B0H13DRAFT_2366678 [Mycena leptocephala]|nr:hypothetical protein B0H13DRAFT_2366678 [Mycena leptocephala]